MTAIDITINKYAQGKLPYADIMNWFDTFSLSEQKVIIEKLAFFIQQAHPTEDLIYQGKSSPH
ncbi:DUF5958 family protein [Algivirga pacifica]|uniref:Uncharacterized protein n=1 Tax=Algivirga pacifica TaxID=1162670 RepID=A0ABP9DDI5_9BACT